MMVTLLGKAGTDRDSTAAASKKTGGRRGPAEQRHDSEKLHRAAVPAAGIRSFGKTPVDGSKQRGTND
jgi:hypothetical protein